MSEFGFELDEIEQLVRLVESRGLARLEVAEEERRVVIRGQQLEAAEGGDIPVVFTRRSAAPKPASPDANRLAVRSPMVGMFYRAASPDAAPLVEVGDLVEIGQPIGLIEAMKVFSEIPSEQAGVVVEIVAQNGALVKQGDPLMYLRSE